MIGTTSRKDVLNDMEMLNVFSTICHVSPVSASDHLMAVLESVDMFNKDEIEYINKKTTGKR